MRFALGLLCLLCTTMVHADIYKYVDESGHVTYSNTPREGAKPVGEKPTGKAKSKAASPYYFPRVDKATQQKRDDMRRQLLLEELQSEQRSLAAARSAQSAEAMRLHEKNIEMLNKELSRIK